MNRSEGHTHAGCGGGLRQFKVQTIPEQEVLACSSETERSHQPFRSCSFPPVSGGNV